MARPRVSVNVRLADLRTTGDLLAGGLSPGQIRSMAARGVLVRIANGVYVQSEYLDRLSVLPNGRFLVEAAAALMTVAPGSVLSHRTAAKLHGLDLLAEPRQLEITHRPGNGRAVGKPGVVVHRAILPPRHVGGRWGVPVTTPARTVTDLARTLTFAAAVVVADSALHQKQASDGELQAVLAECQRWRGARQAAEVFEFANGLAESALESLARIAFRDCGLPRPELQVRILAGDEFIGRVDFLWPEYRTIAEVDGQAKYADPARARAQLRRDKRLREAGYEVVHFDWREITTDPAGVAQSVRVAFRRGAGRAPVRDR